MKKRKLIKHYDNLKRIQELREDYPLAVSKLWRPYCHRWDGLGSLSPRARGCGQRMIHINNNLFRCETCNITEERTSQRQALLSLGSEATLIGGGNRAGKSELCDGMLATAYACGSGEWWVREWLALNDLPLDMIPKDPSEVWVSALSYGDAITYVRPKIEKYAPKGTRYVRWRAQDRAEVIYPNGGLIRSLSADAGRKKYQGGAVSLVVLDEEHPQDIFDECMLRCVDKKGSVVMPMTPLLGMTWVFDIFIDKPQDGYQNYSISGLDNPFVSSVKLRKTVSHLSEESQRSRLYGEFTSQQGLVYSEFSRATHVIPSFDPPAHWDRYRAIDFGVRNPFACLYFAHDPSDDVVHVYREYYAVERTSLENGRIMNEIQNQHKEEYEWTVADPESRDGRLTLARECNIETYPAPKHLGVAETINWVKERLSLDAEGNPHILIHDNCLNLLKEFRLYRWSESKGLDKPIKQHDHALDALRYFVAFHKRILMQD